MTIGELLHRLKHEQWRGWENDCPISEFAIPLRWHEVEIEENLFDKLKEMSEESILKGNDFIEEKLVGFAYGEERTYIGTTKERGGYRFIGGKTINRYRLSTNASPQTFSFNVGTLLKWGVSEGIIDIPDLEQKLEDWEQFVVERIYAERDKRGAETDKLLKEYVTEYREKYRVPMEAHKEMVERKEKVWQATCLIKKTLPLIYSVYETLPSDMQHYDIDMDKMEARVCEDIKKIYEYARLMRQARRQLRD